jgi:xanthine/uracil permease
MGEAIGAYYTVAGLDNVKLDEKRVRKGLTGEWIGTIISLLLGGLTTSTYAQNIGSIQITKIGARRVFTATGILLIVFGLIPKIGAFILSIPPAILGGTFFIIYTMLLITGLRIISNMEWTENNMLIVGLAIALGLGISLVPATAFSSIPPYFRSALISPVVLTASTAIILNLIINLVPKWIKESRRKKIA